MALPNGSRLSCGATARWRKRPALRYERLAHKRTLPLNAGPGSFKRLLGGTDYRSWSLGHGVPQFRHRRTFVVKKRRNASERQPPKKGLPQWGHGQNGKAD